MLAAKAFAELTWAEAGGLIAGAVLLAKAVWALVTAPFGD